MDVILGWLDRSIGRSWTSSHSEAFQPLAAVNLVAAAADTHLSGLLHAYGYLIAAISYVGAEQALCSVFHSFVCFSHRETFYYANLSFAGEAVFRLYRHAYPLVDEQTERRRPGGWRTAEHGGFFPELADCRREIVADLDYIGLSTDPSLCSASRKNETRFHELDQLTDDELPRLVGDVRRRLDAALARARLRYVASAGVVVATGLYAALAAVAHCVSRRQSRCGAPADRRRSAANRKRKRNEEEVLEASMIYAERPAEPTAKTATPADSGWQGDERVEHCTSTELAPHPRASSDIVACNDVSFTPDTGAVDCDHRHRLSPPPPPNFAALRVACV